MTRSQGDPPVLAPVRRGLRVHHMVPVLEDILGPGRRAVVWVQGCTIRCRGCVLPEAWDSRGGREMDPDALAEALLTKEVEGLTVTGGEPTEQAEAVARVMECFRRESKNTWLYTGRTLGELRASGDLFIERLLAATDVLVDGPFVGEQAEGRGFRGSRNQLVHRLTGAIAEERLRPELPCRVVVDVNDSGRLLVVGIPGPGLLDGLHQRLAERGFTVKTTDGSAA